MKTLIGKTVKITEYSLISYLDSDGKVCYDDSGQQLIFYGTIYDIAPMETGWNILILSTDKKLFSFSTGNKNIEFEILESNSIY